MWQCAICIYILYVSLHSNEEAAFLCVCDTGAWVSECVYELGGTKKVREGKGLLSCIKLCSTQHVGPDTLCTSYH